MENMITPDTIIKFGKYKNNKISDIPVRYLIELYKSIINCTIDEDKKDIIFYVEANLAHLMPKKKFTSINTFVNEVVNKMCPKEFYINESDAKYRLNHIRKISIKYNRDNKIPIRVYECERCGYWHLTSKPLYEFENTNPEEEKEEYEPILKDVWLKLVNNE